MEAVTSNFSFYNHNKTNNADSEDTTSVAMVLPIKKELELHLKQRKLSFHFTFINVCCDYSIYYSNKPPSLPSASLAARNMLSTFNTQFIFTDTSALKFVGVYVTATLLLNLAD